MGKLLIFMGIIMLIAGLYWIKEFVKRNSMLDLLAGTFIAGSAVFFIILFLYIRKEKQM